jgi:PGF-pre-PGF domain-containing protein
MIIPTGAQVDYGPPPPTEVTPTPQELSQTVSEIQEQLQNYVEPEVIDQFTAQVEQMTVEIAAPETEVPPPTEFVTLELPRDAPVPSLPSFNIPAGVEEGSTVVVPSVVIQRTVEPGAPIQTEMVTPPVNVPAGVNVKTSLPPTEGGGVTALTFSTNIPADNVQVHVQSSADMPPTIENPPEGETLSYVDIAAPALDPANTRTASITFNVDKAWIEQGNIDVDTIRITRFDEDTGVWVEYETMRIGETETGYVFEALVDHLSVFAIVGSVKAPAIPPKFEVSNLLITPHEVQRGGIVTISVNVTNVGEQPGVKSVTFKTTNRNETTSVKLTPLLGKGESATVSYLVTGGEPGDYQVTVEELSGSFKVVAPPVGIMQYLWIITTQYLWIIITIIVIVAVATVSVYATRKKPK